MNIKKIDACKDMYLTDTGLVYNSKTKKYIKPYSDNCFKLKTKDGTVKTISLKRLYKEIYNKIYCIDNIQNIQNQQWKQIANSQYFISSKGRVKSYKGYYARLLKPKENKKENGYLKVKLSIDNKIKSYFVHVLVATYFCNRPKDDGKIYQVHHRKGRLNNEAQFLVWLTKEEHTKLHNS